MNIHTVLRNRLHFRKKMSYKVPMNISHLRLFNTVAGSLSLSKASKQLRTSQSSISHQLRVLQEKYGVKLYQKSNGGIALTKEGRCFLKDSQLVLSQVDALEHRLLSVGRGIKQATVLRVAASYGPSEFLLPVLLARMKNRWPEVEVIFRTADSWTICQLVRKADVEIALVNNVIRSSKLSVEPFSDEEVVAITSIHSPLAKKSMIGLGEFASLPLVVREGKRGPNQRGTSLHKLMKLGLTPNVVMRCESFNSIKSAVENGIGVGLLSREHLERDTNHRLKAIRIPELQMKLERVIIYRNDKPLSPVAAEFLELLRTKRQRT
jgi:LysR family transcriptional regulator, transcriptional activator of the cysJI operon